MICKLPGILSGLVTTFQGNWLYRNSCTGLIYGLILGLIYCFCVENVFRQLVPPVDYSIYKAVLCLIAVSRNVSRQTLLMSFEIPCRFQSGE